MDRRAFLSLMSSLSLVVLSPMRSLLHTSDSHALEKAPRAGEVLTTEQVEALKTIRALEAQLQQQRGQFSWDLHNELRHFYGAIDEAKSLEHANAILARSIMDPYILNTLSDWHDEPSYQPSNPQLAIESLLRRAEEYPNLKYMRTACLIKAADICAGNTQSETAKQLYKRVLEGAGWRTTEALQAYRRLARSKLVAYDE